MTKTGIAKARIDAYKNFTPEERRQWRVKGGQAVRKLTDREVAEIRHSDKTARELAEEYDVSISLIRKIKQGRHRNG